MQIRKKGGWNLKKFFSSETTEPISTKLCWNDPWVVPFQFVSVSAVLYPRWLPLLKIEISSNGQNCSILSQKMPKFELYKHNDELFNIYYRIFYELWTFAYFDRLCKLEKRGDEIKKKSSPLKLLCQSQPNFAEMILGWSPFKLVSVSTILYPRWPPLLKIEISSNGQKLLYFKPQSDQIWTV